MTLPALRHPHQNAALQAPSSPSIARPLGTADWLPADHAPPYKLGDFWLGRSALGTALGVSDDRNICVVAAPRNGKDTSYVITNISRWLGSVLVIDPKGENAIVTARRRGGGSRYSLGMGQKVYILDPFNAVETDADDFSDLKACFNPMDMLDTGDEESPDLAEQMVETLFGDDLLQGDPYWPKEAKSLVTSIILHVASSRDFTKAERNLVTVRKLILKGDTKLRDLIALQAQENTKIPSSFMCLFSAMKMNKSFNGIVSDAGESFAHTEAATPKTMAGILGTARAYTKFIDSTPIKRCLSRSDFSLTELKGNPKGVSIYLSLPQNRMIAQFPWLRLMSALVVEQIQTSMEAPASGHPVLMVLNEFAGLGRMKVMENAVAQINGYGAKMMFVLQSLVQLKDVYKNNWETFMGACSTKVFFGVEDHFTRDYAAKLIGDHEVVRTNRSQADTSGQSMSQARGLTSTSSSSFNFGHGSSSSFGPQTSSSISKSGGTSRGYSESLTGTTTRAENTGRTDTLANATHKRSLLNPDEIGRAFSDLQKPMALVLIAGMQPLAVRRTPYFSDPAFAGCYDPHPTHPDVPTLHERTAARVRQQLIAAQEKRKAEALAEVQRIADERGRQLAAIEKQRKAAQHQLWLEEADARAEQERKRARRWLIFKWSALGAISAPPVIGFALVLKWWHGLYGVEGFLWPIFIVVWFWAAHEQAKQ